MVGLVCHFDGFGLAMWLIYIQGRPYSVISWMFIDVRTMCSSNVHVSCKSGVDARWLHTR